MADYNKIALRASNFGLNLSHDSMSLPFGQFTQLTNAVTMIEGQLTSRPGLDAITNAATADATAIDQVRRLNDSVQGFSTYLVKADTKLDCTTDNSGNLANANLDHTWRSNLSGYIATGFSSNVGSFTIYRPNLSNQVWCYVGDRSKMVKVSINSSQHAVVKNVGMTRPSAAPTFAQAAGGSLTLLATYYYRYTLYDNATGVESLFNSTEAAGELLTGANDKITVTVPTQSVDSATTHARIYRKGGALSTWRLVNSLAYTGTSASYADTNADDAISAALTLDEVSDQPFVTVNAAGSSAAGTPLPFLWGPVNGYVMGCGDPINPGYLYWTNKFNPDSQDPANNVEVTSPQDPLINGFVYDNKSFVFSREGLYQLFLGLDETSPWTPFKTSCGHGLYSPLGFCVGPEVYFLSKDGVYATSGGVERSLTDDLMRPLFNNQTVNGYPPIDFSGITGNDQYHRIVYHRNEIWLSYKATNGSIYTIIYNIIYKRWHFNVFRTAPVALYSDEDVIATATGGTPAQLVIGGGDGRLYWYQGLSDEQGSPTTIPVAIKTGLITMNAPLIHKCWGPVVLDLDPQGASVTVTLYKDKGVTSVATATYTDATRVRKVLNPTTTDIYAEDLQLEITWASSSAAPVIYGYEILYKPDVIALTRWSAVGTNHGLHGWQILRSGYITLRSDGTVTLSVTTMNTSGTTTTDTYSIASTAGEKQKIFIPFIARKSKIFTYTLTVNSASYFRLYNRECEVHVKPWITAFGYNAINPFVGGSADDANQSAEQASGAGSSSGSGGGGGGSGATSGGGNPFNSSLFDFLGAGGSPLIPSGPGQGQDLPPDTVQTTTLDNPTTPGSGHVDL